MERRLTWAGAVLLLGLVPWLGAASLDRTRPQNVAKTTPAAEPASGHSAAPAQTRCRAGTLEDAGVCVPVPQRPIASP